MSLHIAFDFFIYYVTLDLFLLPPAQTEPASSLLLPLYPPRAHGDVHEHESRPAKVLQQAAANHAAAKQRGRDEEPG